METLSHPPLKGHKNQNSEKKRTQLIYRLEHAGDTEVVFELDGYSLIRQSLED